MKWMPRGSKGQRLAQQTVRHQRKSSAKTSDVISTVAVLLALIIFIIAMAS